MGFKEPKYLRYSTEHVSCKQNSRNSGNSSEQKRIFPRDDEANEGGS